MNADGTTQLVQRRTDQARLPGFHMREFPAQLRSRMTGLRRVGTGRHEPRGLEASPDSGSNRLNDPPLDPVAGLQRF